MSHFLYFFLLVFSLAYPLYKSFDKRVNYHKNWKNVLIAIIPMLVYMVIWDVFFTKFRVWGFNPDYNLGLKVLSLPIEEWLFFIIIPFSSVFIYEVVIYFDKTDGLKKYAYPVNIILILASLGLIVFGYEQVYTLVTGVSLLLLLLTHQFILKTYRTYLGRFFIAFLFILIPFFVVNGVLTGSLIPDQVVWYDMTETFGIRIGTIPMEDFFYCLFMMLLTISVYEKLKHRNKSMN